jgi:hypothetical protein
LVTTALSDMPDGAPVPESLVLASFRGDTLPTVTLTEEMFDNAVEKREVDPHGTFIKENIGDPELIRKLYRESLRLRPVGVVKPQDLRISLRFSFPDGRVHQVGFETFCRSITVNGQVREFDADLFLEVARLLPEGHRDGLMPPCKAALEAASGNRGAR